METKKDIYAYLMSVKKSVGYIPNGHIFCAYNVKINIERFDKNVKLCTNEVYTALTDKPIWKYS